ncbi:hypothetical protein BDN71DRAFT_1438088 [Pleurotus eryngii]|uniref:Uncharacterized protein n=1 Tax=Pleurotus eryngii TaxID=5323 RepID=A0A9P6ACR3_PLEER|nr:hypothetical protein BDN71DRAFT_1438088 [Pleurotus eryngii]
MNGHNVQIQKPQGQRSSLFARLFSSSHHNLPSSSMYPKPPPIAQSFLDDPAFSQDPTLHPLHSPVPPPPSTWAMRNASATTIPNFDPLSVPPGHPMLKQDLQATIPARRPPLPPITVSTYLPGSDYDSGAPRLPLQPPNTPQADGPVFTIRHMQPHQTLRSDDQLREPNVTFPFKATEPSNSIPTTLPPHSMSPFESSSSSDSSPSTTPPSSANSHILPSTSDTAIAQQTEEKRKRTFSFFRRKSAAPPPPPPMPSKLAKAHKPPSPTKAKSPIAEVEQPPAPEVPRPGKTRSTTMPELHKADVQPVPLPRSASAPSDMSSPKPIQVRSLDRIDELDETNPFGSHLHHGGPYEAISRLITSKQKHPDLNGGPNVPHMAGHRNGSHQVSASMSIPQSTPMSLNIKPGQVIPRDYAYGVNPYLGPNPSYLGSQRPPANFDRNVHGAASDPGHGQNSGPSYHNAFLHPFPSGDAAVSSGNAQGFNQGRVLQQQPQPSSYLSQSHLSPQQPPQPPKTAPLRKPSPPHQAQSAPPQQTASFLQPPSHPGDRVEFDPYASYSPTARPRALDDAPPLPLSIPVPQERMESAPQNPQQTATPAVKSIPLRNSPPPPQQQPPSYEASGPQQGSNPYLRDLDVKHPPSNSSNNLPLPIESSQQRRASSVPNNSAPELGLKGGANGTISAESVASQQVTVKESSTPSSGRSSLDDQEPENSRNGHSREGLAANQPTAHPITPPNMPPMEINGGPRPPDSLAPPTEFMMPRGIPGVPSSSASSVRTGISRGNRGPPPRVSHLPKKLVMPAPLQQQSNQGGFTGNSYQPSHSNTPSQRYQQQPRYPPPMPHYPGPQHAAPMSSPHGYLSRELDDVSPPPRPGGERHMPQSLDENVYYREYAPRPGPTPLDQAGPSVVPEQYRQQVYFQNAPPMPPMPNQHRGRQPPFQPEGYNPRGVPPSRSLSPRAQEIPMTTDRKVLRKRSKVGSSESIPRPEMYQPADAVKEMSVKEKAKRDKREKEREKVEAKEQERMAKEREKNEARERKEREKQIKERERALKGKVQVKVAEPKAGQKIPKRVLSKRRNDM